MPTHTPFDPLLVQLSQSIDGARTVEELVRPLLDMLQALTGLESTYLTSIDARAARQNVLYARNTGGLRIDEGISVPWEDTLCRRALAEGCTQTDDVPGRWPESAAARALGLQTYVSVPVHTGQGELYGTLCAASATRHVLDANAEHVLRLFSRLIGQQIEREALVEALRRANSELSVCALSDALTGLPNRRALEQELGRMLARVQREGRALLVAFLDLDGMKLINDGHGHAAGDRCLVAVARALEATLRGGDLVARIGGDEFVVVATLPRENAHDAADVLATRLAAAAQVRIDLDGGMFESSGASVGAVLAMPGETDASAVLARADRAMYEVKRARHAREG